MSGLSGVRRRIPRYPVAIPVDITVLRSGNVRPAFPGRSLDLGEGGVAAVLAAELQLGEWVGVQFQLPNAAQALQTKAVVRHHNQLRCGFEFQGLSPDQRSMIRSWAGNSEPLQSSIEPACTGFSLDLNCSFSPESESRLRFLRLLPRQKQRHLYLRSPRRRRRRPRRRAAYPLPGKPATQP